MLRLATHPRLILAFTALTAMALPSAAQAPKFGSEKFTETRYYGFEIKTPKGWEFVPPSPAEGNAIGKYVPGGTITAGGGLYILPSFNILKFDNREGAEEEAESIKDRVKLQNTSKDMAAWLKRSRDIGAGYKLQEEKKFKAKGVLGANEYLYKGTGTQLTNGLGNAPAHVHAVVFDLEEDLQVALVWNGPADKKRWSKWKGTVSKVAKSFKRLELEEVAGPADNSLRARKQAEIEEEVARSPGWQLFVTDHYFIVSAEDDRDFNKEVVARMEGLHERFREAFPPEKAIEALAKRSREKKGGKPGQTLASSADPLEASRCSVVRVCKDRGQYMDYGAPPGSAGYWWPVEEQLVVYDDQAGGGRNFTWEVLAHEAFHQYIFYYGNLSPHTWFNEGNADYYASYKLNKRGRFELKGRPRRMTTVEQNIRVGNYAPIKTLVNFTHSEYYGSNNLGLSQGDCYAQGWSFVHFLRHGEKDRAKGFKPEWSDILGVYLDTLINTGEQDAALEKAFAGVDFDAMEESWLNYISG